MPVVTMLSLSALRYAASGALQAVGVSDASAEALVGQAKNIAGTLLGYFTDHGVKLSRAITAVNERSWRTLEVALAGDTFWDRCKAVLTPAEVQAFAGQVRQYLDRAILSDQPDRGQEFRQSCLQELRMARQAGALSGGGLDRDALEQEAGSFARYADPQALLDAEWRAVEQMGDELNQSGYVRLGQLLRLRTAGQYPLLVVAARFYFRRAVETDAELHRGLTFAKLEALSDTQDQGFRQVGETLERHFGRLEQLLEEVQAVVVETHGGVQRIEQMVLDLARQMSELTSRLGLQDRQVRATDMRSFQGRADDLRRFEDLLAQFQALPATARQQRPDLMSIVARLENAAGRHEDAVEHFKAVAALLTDDKGGQAAAHHNAYRAALEKASKTRKKEDWHDALAELVRAINKDRRYLPFDAKKYQPQRILGAGGFGVTFLCKRRGPDDLVAVKSLTSENLDRDTDKVLGEGRLLGSVDHPAVIRMIDCDYVDPDKKVGPFLVMAYFDGQTLEDHIDPKNPLAVKDALALFRLVAEGMQAAHAKGVWHRDIKPANLLVRKEAAGWQAKIIDFGLALRLGLTQEGMNASTSRRGKSMLGQSIGGTLHYAAPEQLDAERLREVGPWSDVFGFGRTCYYALFGTPTPDDDDKDGLPEGLKRLLSRCTSQVVSKRPQSFTEVIAQLAQVEDDLIPVAQAAEVEDVLEVVEEVAPAVEWHYTKAGKQFGPVSEEELRSLLAVGKVLPTDLVWKKGLPGWVAANTVEGLLPKSLATPSASVAEELVLGEAVPVSQRRRSKPRRAQIRSQEDSVDEVAPSDTDGFIFPWPVEERSAANPKLSWAKVGMWACIVVGVVFLLSIVGAIMCLPFFAGAVSIYMWGIYPGRLHARWVPVEGQAGWVEFVSGGVIRREDGTVGTFVLLPNQMFIDILASGRLVDSWKILSWDSSHMEVLDMAEKVRSFKKGKTLAEKTDRSHLLKRKWEPVNGDGPAIQFTEDGAMIRFDGFAARFTLTGEEPNEVIIIHINETQEVRLKVISLSRDEMVLGGEGGTCHYRRGKSITDAESQRRADAAMEKLQAVGRAAVATVGATIGVGIAVLGVAAVAAAAAGQTTCSRCGYTRGGLHTNCPNCGWAG